MTAMSQRQAADPWAGLSVPCEHRPRLSCRPVPDEFAPAPLAPPSPRNEPASPVNGKASPATARELESAPPLLAKTDAVAEAAEVRTVEDQLCSAVAALLHERMLPVLDARLRATLSEELPPLLRTAMGLPVSGRREAHVNFGASASAFSLGSHESCESLCLTRVALEEVSEPAAAVAKRVPKELTNHGEPGPEPFPDVVTESRSVAESRYTRWDTLSRSLTSTKASFRDRMAIVGTKLQRWFHADHPLWEPLSQETSFIAWVVDSYFFGAAVSSLVILNSIHMGISADHKIRYEVSQERYDPDFLWLEDLIDVMFVWVFLIEVGLRVYAERRVFLFGESWRWNLFDVVLLSYSFLEKYGGFRALSFLRKLRMLRLVRVLHVLQYVESLEVLRRMITGVMRSVIPVIWVMVVFLLLIYMFSLFFVESIVDFVQHPEFPDDPELMTSTLSFLHHYGSLSRTMISLFMAISGGDDWSNVVDPLWKINNVTPGVFMVYLIFMIFAVVNIVTGIFVEQAMEVAEVDKEKMVRMRVKAMHELAVDIKVFFKTLDEDQSGTLSWEEFERHLNDPRVSGYFELLGIEPASAQHVFRLLDNETHARNSVPINAFIDGCMRFRGPAKSVDVALLMMECHRHKDELRALSQHIRTVL